MLLAFQICIQKYSSFSYSYIVNIYCIINIILGGQQCTSHVVYVCFPDNVYRECLANGTWAKKGNYSQCQEILNEEVRASLFTTRFFKVTVRCMHTKMFINNDCICLTVRMLDCDTEPSADYQSARCEIAHILRSRLRNLFCIIPLVNQTMK